MPLQIDRDGFTPVGDGFMPLGSTFTRWSHGGACALLVLLAGCLSDCGELRGLYDHLEAGEHGSAAARLTVQPAHAYVGSLIALSSIQPQFGTHANPSPPSSPPPGSDDHGFGVVSWPAPGSALSRAHGTVCASAATATRSATSRATARSQRHAFAADSSGIGRSSARSGTPKRSQPRLPHGIDCPPFFSGISVSPTYEKGWGTPKRSINRNVR
jgi:hypothetical protein